MTRLWGRKKAALKTLLTYTIVTVIAKELLNIGSLKVELATAVVDSSMVIEHK